MRLTGPLAALALLSGLSCAAAVRLGESTIAIASVILLVACGVRLASPPLPTTASRRLGVAAGVFANVVMVVTALALSLAAAEGATRWFYRGVTSTADFRGYFTLKWMRADVRHNHYGYRGAEFDEVKPAAIYRVAAMGDSFTYGNGLTEPERYTDIVAAAVKDRGVEVLNVGFPGNNWPEHVATLERRVLRLRPDFVLLQWGSNDIELDRDVAARPRVPPIIARRDWHEWLYERSALYTILNARWIGFQLQRQMGDTYDRYLTRLYAPPDSDGARQAEASMRRFIALCRKRGVAVGLVLFPDAAVSLGPDYPYRFMHDQVQRLCAAERVTCLDLLDPLSAVADRFRLWVTPLDSHPSALANRLAAEQVLAVFAPRWVATR